MALSQQTVWEVRTTGADTNGGGFLFGASGTDRSQQDAAYATGTNLTVDATTNTDVAPDGYTPDATDVGNLIQITAGAGFTIGFYEIKSIQSGKWRLDRSPAAVTTAGGTWSLGGALLSPAVAVGAVTASLNLVWVKAGTYTISTTTAGVSGGKVFTSQSTVMEGYQTTRGDLGTKPLLQVASSGVTSITVCEFQGSEGGPRNISVDGQSKSSIAGIRLTGGGPAVNCSVLNCTNGSMSSTGAGMFIGCVSSGHSTAAACPGHAYLFCEVYGGTTSAFTGQSNNDYYISCIASGNTGASSDGFASAGYGFTCVNCTAYGNGRHGFFISNQRQMHTLINCIAEGNGGYGFQLSTKTFIWLVNCAGYNNTSGNIDTTTSLGYRAINFVTGSTSFFVNAAARNFALNNAAGGGASCKAIGYPTTFPGGATANYVDLGAAQAAVIAALSAWMYPMWQAAVHAVCG